MRRLLFWLALIPGIILLADHSFALSWAKVPGGAPVANDSAMYGVVVLSDTDVWAVGDVAHQPLAEHWDGAVWTAVHTPHLQFAGQFRAVAARSPNDIWAVGESGDLGQVHTLIEHWTGSRWVAVTSPNVGTYDLLTGVAVISRDDVWAVGYSISPTVRYILMHWDGAAWSLVNGPAVNAGALSAIKAFAADDIWAVGTEGYFENTSTTLTLHWNGTAWSRIPSPNAETQNYLGGVDGIVPDDVWAVGSSTTNTLAMHWDGTAWNLVPTPVIAGGQFYAVKVIRPTLICAVGTFPGQPLTERWDGNQWHIVPTPPTESNSILFAISARHGAVWAAGYENYFDLDELFLTLTP
jgi:hypothetical protein